MADTSENGREAEAAAARVHQIVTALLDGRAAVTYDNHGNEDITVFRSQKECLDAVAGVEWYPGAECAGRLSFADWVIDEGSRFGHLELRVFAQLGEDRGGSVWRPAWAELLMGTWGCSWVYLHGRFDRSEVVASCNNYAGGRVERRRYVPGLAEALDAVAVEWREAVPAER